MDDEDNADNDKAGDDGVTDGAVNKRYSDRRSGDRSRVVDGSGVKMMRHKNNADGVIVTKKSVEDDNEMKSGVGLLKSMNDRQMEDKWNVSVSESVDDTVLISKDHSGDDDRKVEMMRALSIIFGNDDGSHDGLNHRNINNVANNDTTTTNNNNITSITTHDYHDVNYWMNLMNHSEDARTLFLQHLDERRSDSMLLNEKSYDVMCVAMKVCLS